MFKRRTPESALLKKFEISGYPLKIEVYSALEPAMIRWIEFELVGYMWNDK